MKKFLLLLAIAGGATALASVQAVGLSPDGRSKDADIPEARACAVLLKRMNQSAEADTWRNRMRLWPCLKRADGTVVASAGKGR